MPLAQIYMGPGRSECGQATTDRKDHQGDAALITTHTGCLSGPSVSQVPLSQWGVDGVPVKPRMVCDGRYLPGLQDLLTDPELSLS